MEKVAPSDQPDEHEPVMRSAAWATFRDAMTKPWEVTLRLCLLMLVRYGVIGFALVHLCGLILERIH